MRIAVLADAHGNQRGFFAALDDARHRGPDLIVSAGDMLCSFPGGREILRTLVSERIPCVRGNGDDRLLQCFDAAASSSIRTSPQFLPLQFSYRQFREADYGVVRSWPLIKRFHAANGAHSVLLCHGTPQSNTHSIADFESEPVSTHLRDVTEAVIVAGHYHHQWSKRVNGRFLVLAGSCGMPCADGTNAQYAVIDISKTDIQIQHQSVEYDHEGFIADLVSLDYVRQAGPVGWLELSQLLLARPLMLYYFRDAFDPTRGADPGYLTSSVREHLQRHGALAPLETAFGPLVA